MSMLGKFCLTGTFLFLVLQRLPARFIQLKSSVNLIFFFFIVFSVYNTAIVLFFIHVGLNKETEVEEDYSTQRIRSRVFDSRPL